MKKSLLFVTLAALWMVGCQKEKVKEVIDLPRAEASAEVKAAVDSFIHATHGEMVQRANGGDASCHALREQDLHRHSRRTGHR